MDLSILDKSSNVTPLLVRLYDSHKLYGLAKDKQPLARAELTSAVSELLDMELSEKETALIADVLTELLRKTEIELRQALAEKLSVKDNVPLSLVLQLANDDIPVASPVLKNSPVLGDLDLIYIIKSKGPEYWQAIAHRKQMNDQVINVLAETRDFDTAMTLAENMNITLAEQAIVVLSDLAQETDILATPLLRRDEITNDIASKLYEHVSADIKKFITDNYEIEASKLIDTVDDVVLELQDEAEANGFIPNDTMLSAAKEFNKKGLLTLKLMVGTLRRGQVKAFVAQFAVYTGLDIKTIEGILNQANGQGLAVACRALDIPKQDFVSIFLLTNRARSAAEMIDVKDMNRAVSYFNRIEKDVAKSIMKNSLQIKQ